MNILLVTPMPPQQQPTNAVPLVTHALIAGLAARHQVTLVTVADEATTDVYALDYWRAAGVNVQVVQRPKPVGWQRWRRRWRLAGTWLAGHYPWRTVWFWEPAVQCVIDRLLAEQPFDLYLVDDNAAGIYRCQALIPTILIEHEVRRPRAVAWQRAAKTTWLHWALGEADWRRWGPYQTKLWRTFDRLQVFTKRDAEAVAAMAPALADRVRVNPFGIDLPPTADPSQEEAGTLIFVGGFSHQPNVDAACWLATAIMPLLRECSPGARLLIVGSHPPAEVTALADTDISVLGRVPEIEPFLMRAAVILAPVRIGGGMRMKVLQGMALGKPVVTTTRGAEGLHFDQSDPPVVVADSAEAIAAQVAALLASPATRRRLGQQARAFVEAQHSAAAYAGRLEAIYAELRSGRTPEGSAEAQNCQQKQQRKVAHA